MSRLRPLRLRTLVLLAGLGSAFLFAAATRVRQEIRREIAWENEKAVYRTLRSLHSAQQTFREGDRDGDMTLDYATTLAELGKAGLIGQELASGTCRGYQFSLSGSTFDWQCSATPMSPRHGRRNFVIPTDGVVRFATSPEPAISYMCPAVLKFTKNAPSALGYSSIQ